MNTRLTLIALLASVVTLPAMADTANGVTRESVRAEYLRASKAGELDYSREFISAPTASRKAATESAAAAPRIEDLPPTAAGNRDLATRTVPATQTAQ